MQYRKLVNAELATDEQQMVKALVVDNGRGAVRGVSCRAGRRRTEFLRLLQLAHTGACDIATAAGSAG